MNNEHKFLFFFFLYNDILNLSSLPKGTINPALALWPLWIKQLFMFSKCKEISSANYSTCFITRKYWLIRLLLVSSGTQRFSRHSWYLSHCLKLPKYTFLSQGSFNIVNKLGSICYIPADRTVIEKTRKVGQEKKNKGNSFLHLIY